MEILTLEEPVLGIDIGQDVIRIAELALAEDRFVLRNFGLIETPEGSFQDGDILHSKKVGKAIKRLIRQRKFKSRRAVAAIRGGAILTRIITLPFMPHERLKTVVETEVNRYVKLSNVEKVIFYQPLEEFDEGGRRKMNVLLAVARKDQCFAHFNALRAAGLIVEALEIGHYAILRLMQNGMGLEGLGPVICVAVDRDAASVNIFRRGALRFNRIVSFPEGSDQNGHLSKLHSEILMASHYYQLENARQEPIESMTVSVATPSGQKLFKKLSRSIDDMRVEYHAAFSDIGVKRSQFPKELLDRVDFSFVPAVGLSMRGKENTAFPLLVDVRPPEAAELEKFRLELKVFFLAFLLVLGGIFFYNQSLGKTIQAKQDQAADFGKIKLATDEKIKVQGARIRNEAPEVTDFLGVEEPRMQRWSVYLEELRGRVNAGIQFTGLVFNAEAGRFTLDGFADSDQSLKLFLAMMEDSPYFSEVDAPRYEKGQQFGRNVMFFTAKGLLTLPEQEEK